MCVKYNLPTIFTISCVIVFFIVALDSDGYLVDTRTEIIVGRQISSRYRYVSICKLLTCFCNFQPKFQF